MTGKFQTDEELREWLRFHLSEEELDKVLLADGLAPAFVGFTDGDAVRLVYSVPAIIRRFIDHDGMSEEEAVEFVNYNVLTSYVGERTPIYLHTPE